MLFYFHIKMIFHIVSFLCHLQTSAVMQRGKYVLNQLLLWRKQTHWSSRLNLSDFFNASVPEFHSEVIRFLVTFMRKISINVRLEIKQPVMDFVWKYAIQIKIEFKRDLNPHSPFGVQYLCCEKRQAIWSCYHKRPCPFGKGARNKKELYFSRINWKKMVPGGSLSILRLPIQNTDKGIGLKL